MRTTPDSPDSRAVISTVGAAIVFSAMFLLLYEVTVVSNFTRFVPLSLSPFDICVGMVLSAAVAGVTRGVPDRTLRSVVMETVGVVGAIPSIWMALIYENEFSVGPVAAVTVVISFFVLRVASGFRIARPVNRYRAREASIIRFLVGLSLVFLVASFAVHGVTLEFHDLHRIYDVRLALRGDFEAEPAVVGLMRGTLTYTIAPFLLSYGLQMRAWSLVCVAIAESYLIFSITAQRAPFSMMGLVLVGHLWLSCRTMKRGSVLNLAIVGLAAAALVDFLLGSIEFARNGLRRLFVFPGLITVWYFDFFSTNEPTLLRGSIYNPFQSSPYDESIPRLIGRVYNNNELTHANTGLFGSAVSWFGLAGLIVVAVALGLFLAMCDSIGGSLPQYFLPVAIAASAVVLINADLIGALLGHGIVLWLPLAYVLGSAPEDPLLRPATFTVVQARQP